ncbi:hypothetical protein L195_g060180, partial [Trifolium pratense]
MFNIFQKYGEVVEVVIPAKRDRGGRRFGFARFDHVWDVRKFGFELDGIIIGRDKICVNVSRFQRDFRNNRDNREDGGVLQDRRDDRKVNKWEPRRRREEGNNKAEGRSFAEIVQGGG